MIIFGTEFKFSFCDKIILVCFGWGPDFDKVDFGNHTVISRQPISSKHCLEIKCRLRVQNFNLAHSLLPYWSKIDCILNLIRNPPGTEGDNKSELEAAEAGADDEDDGSGKP